MDNQETKKNDNSGWGCLAFIAIIAIGWYFGWGPFRNLKYYFSDDDSKIHKEEKINTSSSQKRGKDISFGQSEASKYNGNKCGVTVGGGGYCSCSGCSSANWDPFTCSKCGHKCNKHTR